MFKKKRRRTLHEWKSPNQFTQTYLGEYPDNTKESPNQRTNIVMFMGVRTREWLCIFWKSKLAKKEPKGFSPMETLLALPLSLIKSYHHYHFYINPDCPELVIRPLIFALSETKKKGIHQKLCQTVSL